MKPVASIVITNHNYGAYVGIAIESALQQTYAPAEVVVVDDGSTDSSRDVIERYGDRITAIFQENGGQAAALNRGFERSQGEAVVFLDADDALLPQALDNCIPLFADPDIVKVQWPLLVMDQAGRRTGQVRPGGRLPDGDHRAFVYELGPTNLMSAPTSGNAWSRSYLETVFPIPENEYRICADTYLFESAPFYGPFRSLNEPQGLYRIHGGNSYASLDCSAKRQRELAMYEDIAARLHGYLEASGIRADLNQWRRHSWWHRQEHAIQEMQAVLKPGSSFAFVDDGAWDLDRVGDCRPVPFLEKDGTYWGPPPDDAIAVASLERLQQCGIRYFVVVWSSFWWLQHYTGLHRRLRQFYCPLENDRLVIFDMSGEPVHKPF